jgi:Arc/MetJ-type ribon-helix-helix transcriptional regulator
VQQHFAAEAVAAGRHRDVSNVVTAGVSLLQRAEAARAASIASLDEAQAQGEREGFHELDDVLAEIHAIIDDGERALARPWAGSGRDPVEAFRLSRGPPAPIAKRPNVDNGTLVTSLYIKADFMPELKMLAVQRRCRVNAVEDAPPHDVLMACAQALAHVIPMCCEKHQDEFKADFYWP